MRIRGKNIPLSKIICWALYYSVAIYLPESHGITKIGGLIRNALCRKIFKKCARTANIEKGARFGTGFNIMIGENSGIGINANIPSNTIIGDNVMMGPNCYILKRNHDFSRTDIPMLKQGYRPDVATIIEDDVWIGRNVTMTPGRHILRGTLIGACCLLSKDFPEYSVVGGNPGKLIKNRKNEDC